MTEPTPTIDEIADEACDKIFALYWAACDAKKAAVDPGELTKLEWVEAILDEQFEIALKCESDPKGWEDAREKW